MHADAYFAAVLYLLLGSRWLVQAMADEAKAGKHPAAGIPLGVLAMLWWGPLFVWLVAKGAVRDLSRMLRP